MAAPFVRQGHFPSDDDYYIILDVDFNASQDEISHAYRQLAKKYHPDKHNQDERAMKEAQAIFEKVKTAYDVLGDPHKRQIYDTLGPDGLKIDEWRLVKKQISAQEIRDEFQRLLKLQEDKRLSITARPRASFELAIDASSLFKRPESSEFLDSDLEDEEDEVVSLANRLMNIEISSMSAYMGVDQNISSGHTMTITGDVNAKNGIGDGAFGTRYKYSYSPSTQFDLYTRLGRGSLFTIGANHQFNKKTSVHCKGYLVVGASNIVPGAKLTLAHKIRDYLIGRVSYEENIDSSVSTSLVYLNERLSFEVTTAFKMSHIHHGSSVDFNYNFNGNKSKLSVLIAASTNEGVVVEYGCSTRVLELNIVGAALSLGLQSGITLKLKYNRANQELVIPIYLSDEVHSAPIFYGTIVPLLGYYILDRYYLRHYKKLS